jgi:hypothetical protein
MTGRSSKSALAADKSLLSVSSCPGLSRASTRFNACGETWMAGTGPATTAESLIRRYGEPVRHVPPEPDYVVYWGDFHPGPLA